MTTANTTTTETTTTTDGGTAVANGDKPAEKPAPAKKSVPAKATATRAKKQTPTKAAPAKAATAKPAKATPPRDLTKVTAKEQSELRESVLRMVWATPLYKYRKDAGIPGEVPDQAVLDAIDVFAKYIHPASYVTNNGKVTRRS